MIVVSKLAADAVSKLAADAVKIYNMIKFGSKIAEKVFAYFFTNPHKKLHLQAIARILEVDPGNLSRDMKKLATQNFFKIEEIGNIKLYFLNQKHPIYNELKKIVSKTIGLEAEFRKNLEKVKGILISFIYGSFAKEKHDEFSDIDLMVVGEPKEDDLIGKISQLENYFDREINYVILSPESLQRGFARKNAFLRDVMENQKIFVIGNQNELEKIIKKQ